MGVESETRPTGCVLLVWDHGYLHLVLDYSAVFVLSNIRRGRGIGVNQWHLRLAEQLVDLHIG